VFNLHCGDECRFADRLTEAKRIGTNLSKFGHTAAMGNPVQMAKKIATMQERHGISHTLENPIYVKKALSTALKNVIAKAMNNPRFLEIQSQKMTAKEFALALNIDPRTVGKRWRELGLTLK
jgi:hypothetical protein